MERPVTSPPGNAARATPAARPPRGRGPERTRPPVAWLEGVAAVAPWLSDLSRPCPRPSWNGPCGSGAGGGRRRGARARAAPAGHRARRRRPRIAPLHRLQAEGRSGRQDRARGPPAPGRDHPGGRARPRRGAERRRHDRWDPRPVAPAAADRRAGGDALDRAGQGRRRAAPAERRAAGAWPADARAGDAARGDGAARRVRRPARARVPS